MKKVLIFSALFLLASVSLSAQVVKGAGLWYFNGLPNVTPSVATGTEIAYSINNKALFKWNRTTSAWVAVVQDSSITNELQDLILSGDTLSLTLSDSVILMAQYRNHVWEITNLSDTTSITGDIEGDIAYTSTGDTIAFRGASAWLPFTGGGGGGTFNSFNIAGDTGSDIVTDGQTVTIAGGYGINTAETGGTVTVTADTSQLATQSDISGFGTMSSFTVAGGSGTPQTITNGNTLIMSEGYGINTLAGATDDVRTEVDTTQIATQNDISGLPSGTGTNQRIVVWTGTNSQGNSTQLQSAAGVTLDANLAYRITGGTTASRPTGAAGMMYWNTSNGWFDYHNGTSWFNPARSATTNGLFTAGSVLFGNSDGTIQQNNSNFFFDNSAIEFGIGTSTPSSKLDIQTLALGVTQTNTSGILLSTAGVAASGAQQISPALRWRGLGYGTTAGTSQSVDWRADVLPVQGTVPTSLLRFQSSVNGAAYSNSNSITFGSNGTMGVGTQTAYTSGFIRMATSTDATITSGWYNVDFVLGGYTHDLGVSNGGGYIDFRKISGGTVVSRIHSNGNSYLMGGNVGISTASPDRLLHSELSDAVTNAIVFPLRLTHITSGTAAAGSGAGLEFEAESAGGTNRVAGTIENPYTTATNAAEVSDLVFRTMRAGTLTESLRSLGNGTLQIGTLSGTATQLMGATSGNIATAVTLGAGLSFSSGTLNGAFLPLTLTGATEVNTAGQNLYFRDAAGYPFTFMNSNYFLAASGVNNYIDVGSTASNVKIISDGLIELNSSVNTSIITTGRLLIDGDSTVIDATLPVNTNATHVLVRDASTQRLEEKAISAIGSGVYLPLTLTGNTTVNTAGNQLTISDADTYPYLILTSTAFETGSAVGTLIGASGADISIRAGAAGGDIALEAVVAVSATAPYLSVTNDDTEIGGVIRLLEGADNGTNYGIIKAPDALGTNPVFEVPATNGSSGQFLQTDGSGVTSWQNVSGDGNGIISALPLGDVTIDTDGNRLQLENSASGTGYTTIEATTIYIENNDGVALSLQGNAINFAGISGADSQVIAGRGVDFSVTNEINLNADYVAIGDSTAGSGVIRLKEDTDNGANYRAITVDAAITVNENFKLAATDGTTGQQVITGIPTVTSTLDFGNTAAGTVSDLTVTVTGAAVGDIVTIGVPHGSVPAAGTFFAWVSATNTVTVRFANNALITAYDPGSGSFKVRVEK